MGLCLFFLPNFPGAILIQGATFIPDTRVAHLVSIKSMVCLIESRGYKGVYFLIAEWTSFSVSQQLRPELSAKWIGKIDASVNFIIWKFEGLKSKLFSWVNLRGWRAFILQKDQASVETDRKISSTVHHLVLGKNTLLLFSCQLEIRRSRDSTAKRNLSKDM